MDLVKVWAKLWCSFHRSCSGSTLNDCTGHKSVLLNCLKSRFQLRFVSSSRTNSLQQRKKKKALSVQICCSTRALQGSKTEPIRKSKTHFRSRPRDEGTPGLQRELSVSQPTFKPKSIAARVCKRSEYTFITVGRRGRRTAEQGKVMKANKN